MDLYIWEWVVRLGNKIKLGHGQKSLKNSALDCRMVVRECFLPTQNPNFSNVPSKL